MLNWTNLISTVFFICTLAACKATGNPSIPFNWSNQSAPPAITDKVLYLPISDSTIRKIPVEENQEELINLLAINHLRIKPLANFGSLYATSSTGYAQIRKGVYQRLLHMLNHLPQEIGIAYFEGFRPLSQQKAYFDHKFQETFIHLSDKELAYQETAKLVSPFIDNIPTHCTGAAIDITLFKKQDHQCTLLDMGQFGVLTGVNNQQETFSANINKEQRNNRLLLLQAATQAGLVNYGYEWWHYSFGDQAWAYVNNQDKAIYGLAAIDDPILSIDKDAYLAQFD